MPTFPQALHLRWLDTRTGEQRTSHFGDLRTLHFGLDTQAKWDLKRLVIDLGAQQCEDLQAMVDETKPACVVADVMALSGALVAKKTGLPLALLDPLNLFLPSRDTFPDGFGLAPSRTPLGRLRNAAGRRHLRPSLVVGGARGRQTGGPGDTGDRRHGF